MEWYWKQKLPADWQMGTAVSEKDLICGYRVKINQWKTGVENSTVVEKSK